MSRRIGRKRLYAVGKKGQKYTGSSGQGVSGGVQYNGLFREGQEIVTEIYVDLASTGGAFHGSPAAGTVIAHSSSTDGTQDTDQIGYLVQVDRSVHGTVTTGELICLEAPAQASTGGAYATEGDIDLSYSSTATLIQTGTTGLTAWAQQGGEAIVGRGRTATASADELNGKYLYLTYGGATAAAVSLTGSAFTAGKFIVRLYGWATPDDL